jgi:hypothetical protein
MMGFGHHYHKVVRESETRQLERRHEHARALKESPTRQERRWPGIRESIVSLLLLWRPESPRPAALRDPATGLGIDSHDLTDYVCRLADGSMGHVAIILGPDEEWTAVCVPA